MGGPRGRLRALYGGRHLRTTLVLATTSVAAGTLTGLVGIGMAGTPASQHTPAPAHQVKRVKPHHHAGPSPSWTLARPRPTHSRSASPSPTTSPSHVATTAPSPATSSTPTTAPTTTSPSPSGSTQAVGQSPPA